MTTNLHTLQTKLLQVINAVAEDAQLTDTFEELSELPAIAQYEEFKTKSHPLALCDQIRLMMKPQLRVNCIDYICDRAQQEGHRTLIPQYLNEASEFALANLFHYFQPRDDFPEEETEEIPSQPVARS